MINPAATCNLTSHLADEFHSLQPFKPMCSSRNVNTSKVEDKEKKMVSASLQLFHNHCFYPFY